MTPAQLRRLAGIAEFEAVRRGRDDASLTAAIRAAHEFADDLESLADLVPGIVEDARRLGAIFGVTAGPAKHDPHARYYPTAKAREAVGRRPCPYNDGSHVGTPRGPATSCLLVSGHVGPHDFGPAGRVREALAAGAGAPPDDASLRRGAASGSAGPLEETSPPEAAPAATDSPRPPRCGAIRAADGHRRCVLQDGHSGDHLSVDALRFKDDPTAASLERLGLPT